MCWMFLWIQFAVSRSRNYRDSVLKLYRREGNNYISAEILNKFSCWNRASAVFKFDSTAIVWSCYYMASSVSGQDEPNRALWLATRAGKMELSCPLGTTRLVPWEKFPQKPNNKSFIDQACSVKMAGYWPRSFFFACLWTSTPSRSINTQKRTWPISSHLDRTSLVNNLYMIEAGLHLSFDFYGIRSISGFS